MSDLIRYRIIDTGGSRSFPAGDSFLAGGADSGDVLIIIGRGAGAALASHASNNSKAVLIELEQDGLAIHAAEADNGRVFGFSRFRLGAGEPGKLVELVVPTRGDEVARTACVRVFEQAGLSVAICQDRPGRILDRLMRPYFNSALTRLDDGLAEASDLDRALRLGLGYPRGPIEWLNATGLADHGRISAALHDELGDPNFAPARLARVAMARDARVKDK